MYISRMIGESGFACGVPSSMRPVPLASPSVPGYLKPSWGQEVLAVRG